MNLLVTTLISDIRSRARTMRAGSLDRLVLLLVAKNVEFRFHETNAMNASVELLKLYNQNELAERLSEYTCAGA